MAYDLDRHPGNSTCLVFLSSIYAIAGANQFQKSLSESELALGQLQSTEHLNHHLATLSTEQFAFFSHESLPLYTLRVKKTPKIFCDPTVNSYTGYLDVKGRQRHIFFYFFESRRTPAKDDVLMWINGCELVLIYKAAVKEAHEQDMHTLNG